MASDPTVASKNQIGEQSKLESLEREVSELKGMIFQLIEASRK